MTNAPVISGRQLVQVLEQFGFVLDHQRGSHMMLLGVDPSTTLSVPDHRKLDQSTLRLLLRQVGISSLQLCELMKADEHRTLARN